MSGEYDRLLALDHLTTDDSAEIDSVNAITQSMSECEAALAAFRSDAQMSGDIARAVNSWIEEFSGKLADRKAQLELNLAVHNAARAAMATARARRLEEAEGILMSPSEYNEWARQPSVEVGGVCYTGAAYAAALQDQLRAQRDEIATLILNDMNSAIEDCANDVNTQPGTHEDSEPDPGAGDQYTGTRSGGFNANAATARSVASSASFSAASLASATLGGAVLTTRATSTVTGLTAPTWQRPPAGHQGSPGNPINDPQQLHHHDLLRTPVNRRMTPDGPTGGYLPRDPHALEALRRQRSTAEWLNSSPGAGNGGRTPSMAAIGGMLGVGVATGATVSAASASGVSSLVTSTAGGSALTSHVGGTGMLSMNNQQAASATAGSAPQAMLNGGAASAAASTSHAGAGTSVQSGRSASDRKTKRRSSARIGYDVLRIDDEPTAEVCPQAALESGSALDLAPLPSQESDQW
ncbi:hypothetical protein [Schaalia hyovaginalis]|uniref:hypothetical protein n=1 Tax=Schaalia hyovaginalis TaxID=29316 RepID=UPI002A74E550|nr:hypothetical protein [Schaalia hyovaginalis]MDY2669013.1 hypothetical protein [Schaalia hyovaginalis]